MRRLLLFLQAWLETWNLNLRHCKAPSCQVWHISAVLLMSCKLNSATAAGLLLSLHIQHAQTRLPTCRSAAGSLLSCKLKGATRGLLMCCTTTLPSTTHLPQCCCPARGAAALPSLQADSRATHLPNAAVSLQFDCATPLPTCRSAAAPPGVLLPCLPCKPTAALPTCLNAAVSLLFDCATPLPTCRSAAVSFLSCKLQGATSCLSAAASLLLGCATHHPHHTKPSQCRPRTRVHQVISIIRPIYPPAAEQLCPAVPAS
jgi:hypothetical protein